MVRWPSGWSRPRRDDLKGPDTHCSFLYLSHFLAALTRGEFYSVPAFPAMLCCHGAVDPEATGRMRCALNLQMRGPNGTVLFLS